MQWVPIVAKPRKSSAVRLVIDETDATPRTPWTVPGGLRLDDSVGFGGKSLRKEKTRLPVLATMSGRHLVVDRAVATKLFAPLGDAVVRIHDAPVHDKKGLFDHDYALVDVLARVPLDRSAADADFENGLLSTLRKASWSPERAPRVPVFRLLDRPEFLFVEARIAKSLGHAVSMDDFTNAEYEQWLPTGYEIRKTKPLAKSEKAEEAFWRAYAGSKKDRAAALSHPFWALAVAIVIDQRPADDTRSAASKSPMLAARYAIEVDRGGHDVTRKSAATDGAAVLYYAQHIDFEISASAKKRILANGDEDEETLAGIERDLAEKRAGKQPGVAIAGKWPKRLPARYCEVPKASKKLPRIEALDADLESDIDAFILRGYRRLELPDEPTPEAVVNRVFAAVAKIQAGGEKLTKKTRDTAAMELGCAWGEQLRRTLSWQWAYIHYDGGKGIGLVSRDLAHCHFPLAMIQLHIAPKRKENTIALFFNMATAGDLPKSKKGALTSVQ